MTCIGEPFEGGSDDSPLVVVEVFGVRRRNLERVAFRNFIVVLDLENLDIKIESDTLVVLDRPFVGGKLGVFLARDDGGSEGIARIIVFLDVLEFGGCDVVDGAVVDAKRMGATHIGRSCFVGEFAGVVNSVVGVGVLEAFLIDGFKETRDDGGLLLRSQGRCGVLKMAWSLLGALLGPVGVRFSNGRSVSSCNIGKGVLLER